MKKFLQLIQISLFAVMMPGFISAQITLSGTEIQANTSSSNSQQWLAVAMDTSGNYAVVWESFGHDGNGYGVFCQQFDNTDSPVGVEFRVNTTASNDQRFPAIAMDVDGNFIVVWQSYTQDGDGWGIYAQLYDNTGTAVGSEFLVNTTTAGQQRRPRVAMDDSGNFTVVWESELDIMYQRYDNTGTALGSETIVNTTTAEAQNYPDIAMDKDGDFVVVWQSFAQDGDDFGVYMQRYNNSGVAQGGETMVNTETTNAQLSPRVSSDTLGNYVVVWVSNTQDGSQEGIYGQLYDNTGTAVGSEFLVNTTTSGAQDNPEVQMNGGGHFLVSWNSYGQDGDFFGVYAQLYHNLGFALGDETLINVTITNFQQFSAIALRNSTAIFGWQDGERNTSSSFDGDDYGVIIQSSTLTFSCAAPMASCADYTLELDASGSATLDPADIDGGSSATCNPVNFSAAPNTFSCSDVGTTVVTLTVTDITGNTSSCTATVTVEDNIDPTAICQSVTVQLDANGEGSTTANNVNNGSNDACGISGLSLSQTSFTCADVGVNTVTLTATDANSNMSTCTAAITVEDNIAPTALCQNVTVQLDVIGSGFTTANAVDNGSNDACGISGLSLSTDAFTCGDVGANVVTLTATDVNNNTGTCTATVTVEDNVQPTAYCNNVTVQLNASGNGSTTANAVDNNSYDACNIASLSLSQSTFTCDDIGTNIITLSATDENNNTGTCTATVTVEDNINPTANCNNVTVELDTDGNGTLSTGEVGNGSNDACGIASYGLSESSFDCSDIGTHTVTLTVTDASGNIATCNGFAIVVDNLPPTAICQNVTVQLDASGSGSTTPSAVNNGSYDNCGTAGMFLSQSSFTCADVGDNMVTLSVNDPNDNTGFCTATVTVEDNIQPTAICQGVTVQLDANGEGSASANNVDNGSNDACGIGSLSLNQTGFTCADVGINTVILTATDVNSNTGTCTAAVTVEDNVGPTALCQNLTVQLDASGSGSTSANDVDNGSNDACGINMLSLNTSIFDCSDVGANIVTLTASDVNGNSASCTATVTVEDNVQPTAICNNATIQLNSSGMVTIGASVVNNGSNDACGIAGLSLSQSSFTCTDVGANVITLSATDVNNNTGACTATVTVEDNVDPIAYCNDVTVELDASGNGTLSTGEVNNNSTDACGVASYSLSESNFDCSDVGIQIIVLTVTDVNSNTDFCTATITVEDNIDPSAICQDQTVQLDANGDGSTSAGAVDNGSNDACGIANLSLSETSFDCADVGTSVVTLTATDVNNNTSSCTAMITIQDNIAPEALCQHVTVLLDNTGNGSTSAGAVNNGSSDACGVAFLSLSQSNFDCNDLGANVVTLTVTDANNNTNTCTATVTVEDNGDPNVTCHSATVQLDANGNGTLSTGDVDNGSSDACGIVSLSVSETSFDCSDVGTTVVTLTATDAANNSASCTATINIVDNIQPVTLCQDVTVQLDAGGNGSTSTAAVDNGSNDACGISGLSLSQSSFTCANVGTNIVTLSATDVNNNTGTCTATITVEDNVPPSASCQDVTVQIDGSGNASVNNSDVNDGSSDACGIGGLSLSQSSFTCADLGANVVTLTVTDVNSNTNTCTATITVEDNVPPTAICQDVTVELDANGDGNTTAGAVDNGSSDACGIANLSLSQTSFDCSDVGTTVVTLTVTDGNNNMNSCTATIAVEDNVDPTAICQDVTVQLDASGNGALDAADVDNGSNDACGISSLMLSQSSFTCANVGTVVISLTATDVNSNISTCTATITVEDNVPPTALCQSVNVQLDANGNGVLGTGDVNNGSSDACGISGLSLSQTDFNCSDVGINVVTLTVTDVNSNTNSCTATVTVQDNIPPTALCQNVIIQLDVNGNGSTSAGEVDNGSNDACGIAGLSLSQTAFDCSDVGMTVVTLTATDVNNNVETCTATITVEDNVPPAAMCKNIIVQLDANGTGSANPGDVNNGTSDACGIAGFSLSQTVFDCSNVGVNVVTLIATDVNNNTGTCTATITVQDNIPPTTICQNATVQLDANGNGSVSPGAINNGSNDACGVAGLSLNPNTFNCSNLGANVVTLTATDNNGNTGTCTATVTVVDLIPPTVKCKPATIFLDANGQATLQVSDVNDGSFDNCSLLGLSVSQTMFTCSDIGDNTVKLFGRDQSFNQGFCYATITVVDNIQPTAFCQNLTVDIGPNGSVTLSPDDIDNGSGDNCSFTLSVTPNTLNCSNIGMKTFVTLVVTDAGGNTATCSALVTVGDQSPPIAVCRNPEVFLDEYGQATLQVSDVNNGSSDNCGIKNIFLSQTDFNCSDLSGPQWPVTMTVRDNFNNVSTCLAYVTVRDTIPPSPVCDDVIVKLNSSGYAVVFSSSLAGNSTDNCNVWSYSPFATVYTNANIGLNFLTIVVQDWSGNAATCVSEVTVLPFLSLKGNGDDWRPRNGSVLEKELSLRLYPNPTSGNATFEFELPITQGYRLKVFDLADRMVLLREGEGQEGWNSLPITMGNVAPGVYMLELVSGKSQAVKRLIIQE
ncbi:MAG: T9SS type A sorting domain-containing protein [Lewinellaceae bacterium]|nr:T9SS type A sorting domain-containing protein [Saprospiraceae bacterium]MCB9344820.1 T9SS type A sorting domain-containing protein [Lewinellaceae bacterium]